MSTKSNTVAKFVSSVFTQSVSEHIVNSVEIVEAEKSIVTKSKLSLTLIADELFANGLRAEHLTGEDETSEKVNSTLDALIASGMSEERRTALCEDVRGKVKAQNKDRRAKDKSATLLVASDLYSETFLNAKKQASTTRSVYRSRLVAMLTGLNKKAESDEALENGEADPHAPKSDAQKLLESVVAVRKKIEALENADFDILKALAQVDGLLKIIA